jgi:hypothetical protein
MSKQKTIKTIVIFNKLIECMEKSDKKVIMKRVFLESKPINESNDNKSENDIKVMN